MEQYMMLIKGMAIMSEGSTILSKFYDKTLFKTLKEQRDFEKKLFNKTHRANAEVILIDGLLCVYRSTMDVYFYVIGSAYENELILLNVLNCLYESINSALRKSIDKRMIYNSLDVVMLAFDEICDNGIILDADVSSVLSRIASKGDDISIGEQTMAQVFQSAREQIKWSLLK